MMQFNPQITLRRLRVMRDAHVAYDHEFHHGVNVVRGENSSGKSTILNFIFYALGGALSNWSNHALLCTSVYAEIELNGNPVSVKRDISDTALAPMEIFSGSLEDALTAPRDSWSSYAYMRHKESRESFSQVFFRMLGLPDVAVETSANLTMHQLLRGVYADQLSPVDSIFIDETYDPADLRESIGNLLLGAYDNQIYGAQLHLRALNKEYKEASAELKSVLTILGIAGEGASLDWIKAERVSLEQKKAETIEGLAAASEALYETGQKPEQIQISSRLFNQVVELQVAIDYEKSKINKYAFDINQAAEFIDALNDKIIALQESQFTSEFFEEISFGTCPSCHADLCNQDEVPGACSLCKTPFDRDRGKARVAALINDAAIQIRQSREVMEIRKEKKRESESMIEGLENDWRRATLELEAARRIPNSTLREALSSMQRELGYIDAEITSLERKAKLAEKVSELSNRKADLNSQIERLTNLIDERIARLSARKRESYAKVESEIIDILTMDLKREQAFDDPDTVEFSFKQNFITVDGAKYFSASSRVVLKIAYFIGFLSAALKDEKFRHPRFVMIDITEDKGMEVARTQNLQNIILAISAASEVNHQVIFATSMPSEQIPDSLFVGDFYTREQGSLAFL